MSSSGLTKGLLSAVFAAGLASAMPLDAAIVNFDDLGSETETMVLDSVVTGGLRFTSSAPTGGFLVWDKSSPFNADSDGYTLSNNVVNGTTSVTTFDGTPFKFQSIDLAGIFNDLYANSNRSIQFMLTGLDGSVSTRDITLDDTPGLQTFNFDNQYVQSVSYQGQAQADNFNYTAITAIPEAPIWAMMIGGLGVVGGALRSRKSAEPAPSLTA